jgi:hypothetical protein
MTDVYVSAQSPDKWEDDIVYRNGSFLDRGDFLRQEFLSQVQRVRDNGRRFELGDSSYVIFRDGDIFGAIYTHSLDGADRRVPVIFLVSGMSSGEHDWMNALFSGLEEIFSRTGYERPVNLAQNMDRLVNELESSRSARGANGSGGVISLIETAFYFLINIIKKLANFLLGR